MLEIMKNFIIHESSLAPKATTESWLGVDENLFGSIGKVSTKKEDRAAQKEKEREDFEKKHAPGTHHRELNPFWKDGGSGMPPTKEQMSARQSSKKLTVEEEMEKMWAEQESEKKSKKSRPAHEDEMEAMWAERETETKSRSRDSRSTSNRGRSRSPQGRSRSPKYRDESPVRKKPKHEYKGIIVAIRRKRFFYI